MATFEAVINHLLFFGGSLAFTMALVQFLQIFRGSKHLWLGIFFSCISIIGFDQYYAGAYGGLTLELSLIPGQAVLFMLGPSLFFFYKKFFYSDFKIQFKHMAHFVPPLISLCIDIFMIRSALSQSDSVIEIRDVLVKYNFFYILAAGLIFSTYNVYILTKEDFISLAKRKTSNKVNQIALFFVVMVLAITILLVIAVLIWNEILARFFMTLMIIPFMFVFLVGYLKPDLMHVLDSEIRKNIYERSLIKGLDMEALKIRLEDLMKKDKVFCDEDLTLKRLADMLSISPHQLSEFLNKQMHISFNYYVNRYRVDEAIDLLQEQPERSITSICFSVGFNSKSAFYEAFAKFVGISPARYRRNKK